MSTSLITPEEATTLKQLAKTANSAHLGVGRALRTTLKYALQAGQALKQARELAGSRGRWSAWRKAHFKGSKETCCAYIRLAEHWDDPKVVELRESGHPPTLAQCLATIRGTNTSSPKLVESKPGKLTAERVLFDLKQLPDHERVRFMSMLLD